MVNVLLSLFGVPIGDCGGVLVAVGVVGGLTWPGGNSLEDRVLGIEDDDDKARLSYIHVSSSEIDQ